MSSLMQNAYAMIRILDEMDLYNFICKLYNFYGRRKDQKKMQQKLICCIVWVNVLLKVESTIFNQ